MLEISTNNDSRKELTVTDVDSKKKYTYKVRQAGAGESLKLSQYGREVSKLEKKERSEEEQDRLEELSIKLLQILINLYIPLTDEARDYLDIMSVEDLSGGIQAVFGETKRD